jgi:hypothetical protein
MRFCFGMYLIVMGTMATAEARSSMCDHKGEPEESVIRDCRTSVAAGQRDGLMRKDSSHAAHARHGMLLFGEGKVFASHIVYKAPHNFQVILELRLSPSVNEAYEGAKKQFTNDKIILVLDPFDISQLKSEKPLLSGTLLREDLEGNKHEVQSGIQLRDEEYDLIYFDELPLVLGADHKQLHSLDAKNRVVWTALSVITLEQLSYQ